jgi:hypothetical protein
MDGIRRQESRFEGPGSGPSPSAGDLAGIVLTLVIIELTAATAYIHLSLGGLLFTLNGLGYVVVLAAYLLGVTAPLAIVQRFSWLPRLGLAAYALVTIGAYLAIGPYFTLGWITKAIEVAIIGLLVADLLIAYGGLRGLREAVLGSLIGLGPRGGPRHA